MSSMYLVSKWRHDSTGLCSLEKVKLPMALSTEYHDLSGLYSLRASPTREQIIFFKKQLIPLWFTI